MPTARLRIIVLLLAIGLCALFARALQIQWLQNQQWQEKVQQRREGVELLETTRGRILDYKGRELAINAACIDAVIDYRAILRPADDAWVRKYARSRLTRTLGDSFERAPLEQRRQLLDEQVLQVRSDIDRMWQDLGNLQLTGYTPDQIEERRQQTVRRVQMRRRFVIYSNYIDAEKKRQEHIPSWWQRWLLEDQSTGVELDSFDVTVQEQLQSHVVLPAISNDLANYLGKNMDRYPGLSLRPGEHREYPMNEVACHVLGHIGPVAKTDLENDPNRDLPLRRYWPNDIVGRSGIEDLCEQTLRGTRGRLKRQLDTDELLESIPAEPGKDVTLTIDANLQRKLEAAFKSRKDDPDPYFGAAVILDVQSNEVRALVSYPTYNINDLDKNYAAMVTDEINRPLLNRATLAQREPGSTVKPILGIAGITEGVIGVHEGIECTGKLVLSGKTISGWGKCWTMRRPGIHEHHQIPAAAPHRGKYGNPDGFLVFEDALERSCNVWCEVVADRLGASRLVTWYERFGLNRPTALGLPEVTGRLPFYGAGPQIKQRARACLAGIGQGDVAATPIQMANVAATIARDGLWMRPHLVAGGFVPPGASGPEQTRLPVDPAAIRAAKAGMRAVVNSIPAGTGTTAHLPDIIVAGKTGSAQTARLAIRQRDAQGNLIIENGRPKLQFLELSTPANPNPLAPWYRGTGQNHDEITHAWFIGFAPADRPQVAFAVMVEYGGSGGSAAGLIVQSLLEAAREEGYLPPSTQTP